jgi:alpha-N-arabinofuranosidase
MANIAQTVNVLQSMILTDGARMILTPTYHLFEMYAVHQDATFLPVKLDCPVYTLDGQSIPTLSASASRAPDGAIHLSLCNLHASEAFTLPITLTPATSKTITGRILTAETVNAHNAFDRPNEVQPAPFTALSSTTDGFTAHLPARSIVVLRLE